MRVEIQGLRDIPVPQGFRDPDRHVKADTFGLLGHVDEQAGLDGLLAGRHVTGRCRLSFTWVLGRKHRPHRLRKHGFRGTKLLGGFPVDATRVKRIHRIPSGR